MGPGLPQPMVFLTAALYWARRVEEALAEARRTVEDFPDYGFAHEWLSYAYDLNGMYPEALAAQQEAVRLIGGIDVNRKALLGRAQARAGQHSDALETLNELLRLQETTYVHPVLFAYVHIGLGQTIAAIDWLEKAYEDRDPDMAFLQAFPAFDPLRSEPRFQDLVRRMNFPN